MTYTEFTAALALFGYTERDTPTMAEVKRRQRDLLKACHPDLHDTVDPLPVRRINAAAALITAYLKQYRFSFTEEEFYRQNPDEQLRRQFANDPVWGGGA